MTEANYHIVNLSEYTAPVVKEEKNKGWVEYKASSTDTNLKRYQSPNGYFLYLIDRKAGSTTHKSVLNSITRMVFGKGLNALDSNRKTEDYAKLVSLVRKKDQRRIIKDRIELGEGAMQITRKKGEVVAVTHFPRETLLPEIANKDGEIENYYYCPDWENKAYGDEPKKIPAFGFGNKQNGNEILIIRPYEPGFFYFTPPYFSSALPYALLEEEIADYQINDIQNGFSGTTIINFNNGVPSDKGARKQIAKNTKNKVTGSRGDKVIVSFNATKENETTIEKPTLDNAPEHYSYLSTEAESKILKGHNAPTWILGANNGGQGLSSNADELKNQMLTFDNLVIKPFQQEFIEALDEVLLINDISLKLYFITIQPLEFVDVDGMDEETKEEETGIEQKLSKDESIAELLIACGEDIDGNWDLISSDDVDYDTEDALDAEIDLKNNPKISTLRQVYNLLSTGKAIPNAKSEQDREIDGVKYKVRYSYEGETSENSRLFCKLMHGAGKLYRKEDILRMSDQVVNAGWGAGGTDKYSIWFYKGGGNCHHKWVRKTFKFTGNGGDVRNPNAETISTNKARREGYNPKNEKEVSMKPIDMPNQGFLNK